MENKNYKPQYNSLIQAIVITGDLCLCNGLFYALYYWKETSLHPLPHHASLIQILVTLSLCYLICTMREVSSCTGRKYMVSNCPARTTQRFVLFRRKRHIAGNRRLPQCILPILRGLRRNIIHSPKHIQTHFPRIPESLPEPGIPS